MQGEARRQKYRDFARFFKRSKPMFEAYEKLDPRSHDLSRTYDFYVARGGRNGGIEKRLIQIFFGQRPYESVNELKAEKGSLPSIQSRFLTEGGALLQYHREPSGGVTCLLIPATTEGLRGREDAVLLEKIANPARLHFRAVTQRHWRYLISYMHCTSLDGSPNVKDHVRTAWMRFRKVRVIKGEETGPLIWTYLWKIIAFALTIGLSGFILALLPKPAAPEIVKVQVVRESPELTRTRKAESQLLDDIAKTISAMSHDIKKQTQAPIAVRPIRSRLRTY